MALECTQCKGQKFDIKNGIATCVNCGWRTNFFSNKYQVHNAVESVVGDGATIVNSTRYFHKLTDEEWEQLKSSDKTWEDIMHEFLAPDWCTEGQAALAGAVGCSGLTLRFVKDESYCIGCDFHKDANNVV